MSGLEALEREIAGRIGRDRRLVLDAGVFGDGSPVGDVFRRHLGGALTLAEARVAFPRGTATFFEITGRGQSAPFTGMWVKAAVKELAGDVQIAISGQSSATQDWTFAIPYPTTITETTTLAGVGFTSASLKVDSQTGVLTFEGETDPDSPVLSYLQLFFPDPVFLTGPVDVDAQNYPTFSLSASAPSTTLLGLTFTPTLELAANPDGNVQSVGLSLQFSFSQGSSQLTVTSFAPYNAGITIAGTFSPGAAGVSFDDFTAFFDFGSLLPPQSPMAGWSLDLTGFTLFIDPSLATAEVAIEAQAASTAGPWQITSELALDSVAFQLTLQSIPLIGGLSTGGPLPGIAVTGSFAVGNPDDILSITAYYPGWSFYGELEVPSGNLQLQSFVDAFVPDLGSLFGNITVPIDTIVFSLDPASAAYSFELTMAEGPGWTIVQTDALTLSLADIVFSINYAASNFDVALKKATITPAIANDADPMSFNVGGSYTGGTWQLQAAAKVTADQVWALVEALGIQPAVQPPDVGSEMVLTLTDSGGTTSYTFFVALSYSPFTSLELSGTASVSPNAMTLTADVTFGSLRVTGSYDFTTDDFTFTWNSPGASFTGSLDQGLITLSIEKLAIGELVAAAVSAIDQSGNGYSLAAPFDLLNDIDVTGIKITLDPSAGSLSVEVTPPESIELFFASIQGFTISIDDLSDPGSAVNFQIAGTVMGQTVQPWDLTNPSSTPTVPGLGKDTLTVNWLLLGQRVAPSAGSTAFDSITDAVVQISNDYAIAPGQNGSLVEYSPSTNWVIGAQVSLFPATLDLVIGAVFVDPSLYGINISVGLGAFSGLQFEVLYQRVSSTVGMYEVELTLPVGYRTFELGAVVVVLPSVMLQIYTNGNFYIDFGFPQNENWSDSFSVQVFPFVGFGGFYFGDLSSSTAAVPANGTYSPVIVIGLAVSVGVGETFAAGPLSGGVSLTFTGIAEGTFAWQQPSRALYYSITGQFALVGNAYGVVNFVIITARFDITATIGATVQFSSGGPVYIVFTASVVVTASLTLNLGAFKINLPFSFQTTISDSFTLGSAGGTTTAVLAEGGAAGQVTPQWGTVDGEGAYGVSLLLTPHPTATGSTDPLLLIETVFVAMTYIETAPSSSSDPTPFSTLCSGTLLWCINALLQLEGNVTASEVLQQSITVPQLQQIEAFFQDGSTMPSTAQIMAMVGAMFELDVVQSPASGLETASVAAFPMLPFFTLTAPDGTAIDFSSYQPVSTAELNTIQSDFAALIPAAPQQPGGFVPLQAPDNTPLAELVAGDYFLLLCRTIVQAAITAATTLVADGDTTIDDVIAAFPDRPLTPEMIAGWNRLKLVRAGVALRRPDGGVHHVAAEEPRSLLGMARRCGTSVEALAAMNRDVPGFFEPGTRLEAGSGGSTEVSSLVAALCGGPFDAQAGTVSRIMLQGLRPTWSSTPAPLYALIGQQFGTGGVADPSFTLASTETWITFGDDGAGSTTMALPDIRFGPPDIPFTSALLPVRSLGPRQFTLSGPVSWNPGGREGWTIWQLPADLKDLLASGVQPLLMLKETGASSSTSPVPDRELTGLVPAPRTAWTMTFPIIVQQVPPAAAPASPLQFTYNLIGTDDAGTALLAQFLLQGGVATTIDVAFPAAPGQSQPSAGIISNPRAGSTFFVVGTNLSTAGNPAGEPAAVAATPLGSGPQAMLQAIWEASVVHSGGFYFYYSDDGKPLSSSLFNSNGEAELTIIATIALPGSGALASYVNALAIEGEYDSNNPPLFYLEPAIPQPGVPPRSIPAVTPGTAGLIAQRTLTDELLPSNYQLLGYSIAESGGFTSSGEGLPLTPTQNQADPAGAAVYQTFLPIAQNALDQGLTADLPGSPPPDPYRGVGTTLTLDLQWVDLFGNVIQTGPPAPELTPSQQVLYFDPLFPVGSWPSASASYAIVAAETGPELSVVLDFDTSRYQSSNQNWQTVAQTDMAQYAAIYYQIARNATIAITCSLDGNMSWDVTSEVVAFVRQGYVYLDELLGGQTASVPSLSLRLTDLEDDPAGPNVIFPLLVQITIARTPALVDPLASSPGDPALSVTSTVKPDYAVQTQTSAMTLRAFAVSLNAAFPSLMVATQSTASVTGGSSDAVPARVWLVRFGPGGVQCTYDPQQPNIQYFAVAPLAGTLVSVADVPVPVYVSGIGLTADAPTRSFSDVDLDHIAATFLAAVDQFLSVDYAAPAWLAWYRAGFENGSDPVTQVLAAKAALASALSSQVQPIYATPAASDAELTAAQAFMQQELLVHLSSAYDVDAVVQFAAAVTGPAGETDPPRLYGTPSVNSSATERYSFSSLSVPLGEPPLVTFAFTTNSKSETSVMVLPVSIDFNHLEFQIEDVGTLGYQESSWLTFAMPLDSDLPVINAAVGVDLGTIEIPIPLRSYPNPPALQAQKAVPAGFGTLGQIRSWDYQFQYSYSGLLQDEIGISMTRSEEVQPVQSALANALLAFDSLYPAIARDLASAVRDNESATSLSTTASGALAAFATLANNIANAWEPVTVPPETFDFVVSETSIAYGGQTDVLQVTVQATGNAAPPLVSVAGYAPVLLNPQSPPPNPATYVYQGEGGFVTAAMAMSNPVRSVTISGYDVLVQQSVQASLAIERNATYGNGIAGNDAFVLTTPFVTYATPAIPVLAVPSNVTVQVAESPVPPPLIGTALDHFFEAFLEETTDERAWTIQLAVSYEYSLSPHVPLPAVVPVLLVPPAPIAPGVPLLANIGSALGHWYNVHAPPSGQFVFNLSLFANGGATQRILTIPRLTLEATKE